jgi:hypothetical protein
MGDSSRPAQERYDRAEPDVVVSLRWAWMATPAARINNVRGLLREFCATTQISGPRLDQRWGAGQALPGKEMELSVPVLAKRLANEVGDAVSDFGGLVRLYNWRLFQTGILSLFIGGVP